MSVTKSERRESNTKSMLTTLLFFKVRSYFFLNILMAFTFRNPYRPLKIMHMNNLSSIMRKGEWRSDQKQRNANTFTFTNYPSDRIVRLVGIRRIRIEANIRVTRSTKRIGFDLHIRQNWCLFFRFHSRFRTEVRRFIKASIPISGRWVFLWWRCR